MASGCRNPNSRSIALQALLSWDLGARWADLCCGVSIEHEIRRCLGYSTTAKAGHRQRTPLLRGANRGRNLHGRVTALLLCNPANGCGSRSMIIVYVEIIPQPLSLPLNRTACPYFCSFVINASPCLTTSLYCLFLSSGRFVSIIPLTRSMVQGMRSAAMNFARSLEKVSVS